MPNFKLAESHFKQSKRIDRDIDPIYKALDAYQKLRRGLFQAVGMTQTQGERIQACHRTIAQSYLFVGQFYYRRDAYLAAAHPLQIAIFVNNIPIWILPAMPYITWP